MAMGRKHQNGGGNGEAANLKVISWNLLRLIGAGVRDVAALIEEHRPDVMLMQEATAEVAALPQLVGGHFHREPMDRRVYGLAVWTPHHLPPTHAVPLPVSSMPGRVPPRLALVAQVRGVSFANVHLSHGQFLNRWQLLHVARTLRGPAAIIGDYNAVGPIKLAGYHDIGPRDPTHCAGNIVYCRLDRCMARGLRCGGARVLDRGPSDHHPIVLDLTVTAGVGVQGPTPETAGASRRIAAGAERWLRTM